jgi:hypothetical protein
MNLSIKEEMFLFYNDLQEYQNSIEGKKLDKAFKENSEDLTDLIEDYYTKRNSEKLTYYNEQDLKSGKEIDKYISDLYREQN